MRPHPGDKVTVRPVESDPYILNFQRYATVSRLVDTGAYVTLEAVYPADQEFGPIPIDRLQGGWRDGNGRWR